MRKNPGEMASGLLEVPSSDGTRFGHTTTKRSATELLDIRALYMHSGNGSSDFSPDFE
jgi:hypothetical protein